MRKLIVMSMFIFMFCVSCYKENYDKDNIIVQENSETEEKVTTITASPEETNKTTPIEKKVTTITVSPEETDKSTPKENEDIPLSPSPSSSSKEKKYNPYFPHKYTTEVTYEGRFMFGLDTHEEKAIMKFDKLSDRKKGKLFRITFYPIIHEISEEYQPVPAHLLNLGYFYVKRDKIYQIAEMSPKQLAKLYEDGEIPKQAVLVCQEEVIKDALKKDEPGDHEYIKSYENGIRRYGSYYMKEQGDSLGLKSFTWKRDVGLIAYSSSRTAAGAESIELWLDKYVKSEHYADFDFID